jgi:uncharacterized membrane protein YqjE
VNDVVTRRLVASILGLLGVMVLLDVLVITVVDPYRSLDGFRQALIIIVGALLIVGGSVAFAWPKRASLETTEIKKDDNGKKTN